MLKFIKCIDVFKKMKHIIRTIYSVDLLTMDDHAYLMTL